MKVIAEILSFFQRKMERKTPLEQEFSLENLKSERIRAIIICGIAFAMTVLFLLLIRPISHLFPPTLFVVYRGLTLATWFGFALGAVSIYEAGFFAVLNYCIAHGLYFPMPPRYGNAFIETSIPTALIFIASKLLGTYEPLFSPAVFFYFIFIILSALRLNQWLCLFTGTVAGLEYTAMSLYLIRMNPAGDVRSMLTSPGIHIGRGLILLGVGIATAFVAIQIKKRLFKSFKTVEDRNRIMGLFGQHVSPEVMTELLGQEDENEGEIRDIGVMFLDIRNFTSFTEGKSPAEVIRYLNYLFSFMVDIVNSRNGIINKFLGDGFMAIFGAPISTGEDVKNAVDAGLEIIRRLEGEVKAGNIPPTKIGIGIHAGSAMTGNVGSAVRKEYTIIGDVVNLASRIEVLNKQFGSSMLVSENVYCVVEKNCASAEDLGRVELRGHRETIRLFRLA